MSCILFQAVLELLIRFNSNVLNPWSGRWSLLLAPCPAQIETARSMVMNHFQGFSDFYKSVGASIASLVETTAQHLGTGVTAVLAIVLLIVTLKFAKDITVHYYQLITNILHTLVGLLMHWSKPRKRRIKLEITPIRADGKNYRKDKSKAA